MGGVDVITFGCRLNTFESEAIRRAAGEAGLDNAIVVNTCAVTGEAVRQARQAIRRARRETPGKRVIVTGCAAQTQPREFASMDEVDAVLGNSEKLHAASYRQLPDAATPTGRKTRVDDIMAARTMNLPPVDAITGRSRAFVPVQNGCDHRCTFCIIPFGRGNSRSLPAGAVVEQVARLVDGGYREVVMTGVDLTGYGADLAGAPTLGSLVRAILAEVPMLERLRLSSIDSIEVGEDLLDLIATQTRFMPHLHLSLQHGDDTILKRMKRRHSRADAVAFCERARALRPGIAFGADLIAGFPTETGAMFDSTLSLVEECGLAFVHVFAFSPRPGTPAARMPQLDRPTVKARAARLREKGMAARARHLAAMIATGQRVLMETGETGRAENFTPVLVEGGAPGAIAAVRITGHDGERLTGTVRRPGTAPATA